MQYHASATEVCHLITGTGQTRRLQKERRVLWIISMHSLISSSLITSGGANRIISPCVGLASSPLSRSLRHTFQASQSSERLKRKKIDNFSLESKSNTIWSTPQIGCGFIWVHFRRGDKTIFEEDWNYWMVAWRQHTWGFRLCCEYIDNLNLARVLLTFSLLHLWQKPFPKLVPSWYIKLQFPELVNSISALAHHSLLYRLPRYFCALRQMSPTVADWQEDGRRDASAWVAGKHAHVAPFAPATGMHTCHSHKWSCTRSPTHYAHKWNCAWAHPPLPQPNSKQATAW